MPLHVRGDRFREWISYYQASVQDLDAVTDQLLAERLNLHLREGGHVDPMKTPTVKRITPAEYLEVADPGVVLRSYASMRHVKPEVFNLNMRGALFDTGGV